MDFTADFTTSFDGAVLEAADQIEQNYVTENQKYTPLRNSPMNEVLFDSPLLESTPSDWRRNKLSESCQEKQNLFKLLADSELDEIPVGKENNNNDQKSENFIANFVEPKSPNVTTCDRQNIQHPENVKKKFSPVYSQKKSNQSLICHASQRLHTGAVNTSQQSNQSLPALQSQGVETSGLEMSYIRPPLHDQTQLSSWNLPESVMNKYREKGITEMFEWQAECLSQGKVLAGGNLVYAAPTSAGKTMVAEILMLKRVLETRKRALMILPFVSVAREKMNYLQSLFQDAGIQVDGFMGNHNPAGGLKHVHIAICTIEKANSLINRLIEDNNLDTLGCIVIDELHMIGDSHRGYLLELLLTKILYMSNREGDEKRPQVQIIGMSATLPNLDSLARWLKADLYRTDYRPVPLTECIKVGTTLYNSDLQKMRDLDLKRTFPSDDDHVIPLCLETITAGHSILIFCPSKVWCEKLAESVAREFYNINAEALKVAQVADVEPDTLAKYFRLEQLQDVYEQLRRTPVGLDAMLKRTVPYGVAFHHAGLTFDERDIVEGGFRQGAIRVLVATSTLSSGVNLPARRVIVRTPMFYGRLLDILTYKQMIGRAGRKGVDTEGESILLCKSSEKSKAVTLVKSELSPVTSCLLKDGGISSSLKRAILEVVVSGAAQTREDVECYASCTLLASNLPEHATHNQAVLECIQFMEENELVILNKDSASPRYQASQLGSAILASSLSPDEGLTVFRELQRARQSFVLDTELHLIYEVTPIYVSDMWTGIDWCQYLFQYEALSPSMRRVADLVGVEEQFLNRAVTGRVLKSTVSQRRKVSVHLRFYTALVLHELVSEVPVLDLADKYKCNRGQLQSLQQAAATFAGMVTVFCNRLGWYNLELLMSQFQARLTFGVQRELCDLVRVSLLNGLRARHLYNAGMTTLASLSTADAAVVEAILRKALPFESKKARDGETAQEMNQRVRRHCIHRTGQNGLTETQAAQLIIQEAREILERDLGLTPGQLKHVQADTNAQTVTSPPVVTSSNAEKVTSPPVVTSSNAEKVTSPPVVTSSNAEKVTSRPVVTSSDVQTVTSPPVVMSSNTEKVTSPPVTVTSHPVLTSTNTRTMVTSVASKRVCTTSMTVVTSLQPPVSSLCSVSRTEMVHVNTLTSRPVESAIVTSSLPAPVMTCTSMTSSNSVASFPQLLTNCGTWKESKRSPGNVTGNTLVSMAKRCVEVTMAAGTSATLPADSTVTSSSGRSVQTIGQTDGGTMSVPPSPSAIAVRPRNPCLTTINVVSIATVDKPAEVPKSDSGLGSDPVDPDISLTPPSITQISQRTVDKMAANGSDVSDFDDSLVLDTQMENMIGGLTTNDNSSVKCRSVIGQTNGASFMDSVIGAETKSNYISANQNARLIPMNSTTAKPLIPDEMPLSQESDDNSTFDEDINQFIQNYCTQKPSNVSREITHNLGVLQVSDSREQAVIDKSTLDDSMPQDSEDLFAEEVDSESNSESMNLRLSTEESTPDSPSNQDTYMEYSNHGDTAPPTSSNHGNDAPQTSSNHGNAAHETSSNHGDTAHETSSSNHGDTAPPTSSNHGNAAPQTSSDHGDTSTLTDRTSATVTSGNHGGTGIQSETFIVSGKASKNSIGNIVTDDYSGLDQDLAAALLLSDSTMFSVGGDTTKPPDHHLSPSTTAILDLMTSPRKRRPPPRAAKRHLSSSPSLIKKKAKVETVKLAVCGSHQGNTSAERAPRAPPGGELGTRADIFLKPVGAASTSNGIQSATRNPLPLDDDVNTVPQSELYVIDDVSDDDVINASNDVIPATPPTPSASASVNRSRRHVSTSRTIETRSTPKTFGRLVSDDVDAFDGGGCLGKDWTLVRVRAENQDWFFTEWLEKRQFALAVACETAPPGGKTGSDVDMTCDGLLVSGLAVSWSHKHVYYVTVDHNNLPLIRTILGSDDVTISLYDVKHHYKLLSRACAVLLGPCRDPLIANWLLDPGGKERNLQELVTEFMPLHVEAMKGLCIQQRCCQPCLHLSYPVRASVEASLVLRLQGLLDGKLEEKNLVESFGTEMPALLTVAKMELSGVGFSETECRAQLAQLQTRQSEIEQQCYHLAGHQFNINSIKDVQQVLFVELRLPTTGDEDVIVAPSRTSRASARGRCKRFSTKQNILIKLKERHVLPGLILEWRKNSCTIKQVVHPLLNACERCPGLKMSRLYCHSQYHTATGRIILTEPSLQMIPRPYTISRDQNISIRRAIVARQGCVLLAADYSQLELRMLAHLSRDRKLMHVLNTGGDVFRELSAVWNGHVVEEVTDQERQLAKQICYGMIYGVGVKTMSEQLEITEKVAEDFMESFKTRYTGIRTFQHDVIKKCRHHGYVTTLFGRRRYLPAINSTNPHQRAHAERQSVNTSVQGSAADLVKRAQINIDKSLTRIFPDSNYTHRHAGLAARCRRGGDFVLQVHDELVYEVTCSDISQVAHVIKQEMENSVQLPVKFPVKLKAGESWGDMKDYVL